MRVLLCSDIHANAEALAAVLKEPADYVLCAGDLVHFGPQPKACITLIRKCAAVVVRGNHDHGAAFGESCRAYGPWQVLDERCRTVLDITIPEADWNNAEDLPVQKQLAVVEPVGQIVEKRMTEIDRETQLFLDLSIVSLRQHASKVLRSGDDVLRVK